MPLGSSAARSSIATTSDQTLFFPWDTPAQITADDPTSLEVGLRFFAGVAGTLIGVRFWMPSEDTTATITVRAWSSGGTSLATKATTGFMAGGWVRVNFDTPIDLTAGTVYVVSRNVEQVGGITYVPARQQAFAQAVTVGDLTALGDGNNGVYSVVPGTFPTLSNARSNYFVDPIFRRSDAVAPAPDPGGAPPGGFTDAFSLGIKLPDSNTAPTDAAAYTLALALADALGAQSDAALLNLLGLADLNAAQIDTLLLNLKGLGDTNVTPGEALLLAIAGLGDTVAAQTETAQIGFPAPDFADSSPAPTEASTCDVTSWGTSTTTAGTAPTNAANATGINNGTLATCKAAGVPTVVASTLNVVIARGGVPTGGTKTVYAWYSTNAGVADTFTLTYTATGGTPATITLPAGNFLTTPFSQAITEIGGANDPVFTFTHTAVTAATGGSISVDAVAIKTAGAF
jgi:hypothetical protein